MKQLKNEQIVLGILDRLNEPECTIAKECFLKAYKSDYWGRSIDDLLTKKFFKELTGDMRVANVLSNAFLFNSVIEKINFYNIYSQLSRGVYPVKEEKEFIPTDVSTTAKYKCSKCSKEFNITGKCYKKLTKVELAKARTIPSVVLYEDSKNNVYIKQCPHCGHMYGKNFPLNSVKTTNPVNKKNTILDVLDAHVRRRSILL